MRPALRHDLISYLLATSVERARIMGELTSRNPRMADELTDLETDDTSLEARDRASRQAS